MLEKLKYSCVWLPAVCLAFLLTACGSYFVPSPSPMSTATATLAPPPSATATLTLTSSPTIPFTPTSTSTKTPIPLSPTPNLDFLFDFSGKPLPFWNGIPVMPQAVAGEEKSGVYYYYIKAGREEVHQYYLQQMPYWGWQLFASGTKHNGDLLIFIKSHVTVTVGIVVRGNLVSVMLVNS